MIGLGVGWRLLRCVAAYLLDHHKMSPIVREGRRQVQIGPGSDKKRFQNGRRALVALLVHIYKWCIANFLPSQHQSVWHSCNALHSTAPVHQCTNPVFAQQMQTALSCYFVLWLHLLALQCNADHYSALCVQQCSAVQCESASTCLAPVYCHTALDELVHKPKIGNLEWE